MFPYGLPTCKEQPVDFWFRVYSKYTNWKVNTKISKNDIDWCNGNAVILENLPIGKYIVPV